MDWGELKKQIVSVTVSKPEQQGKGRKKFTDFLVTALFDNGAEALSRRTFEDFQWLYHRLVNEYLGIIVPVLPERKPATAADKFSEAFVNDCQAVLQRFMERVIAHPDLLQSSNLLKFLTSSPSDWKTIKEQVLEKEETTSADGSLHSNATSTDSVLFIDADAASAPPEVSQKKPGMMSRWWAERAERKALNNPKYQMEESQTETKKFNEIEEYCDHLYECIAVIEENAKVLTAAYQTQAERLQTMGAAFQQLWGEHELSNTSASVMYQTVGDSWGSLHKQVEGQHAFGVVFFDAPMEELRLDVMALKQALKKRKKVVYDYTVKMKEARNLQKQMDKLKGVPDLSVIAEKYYKVEHYAKAKDQEVAEAKHLTEVMGSRLTRDIERFRIEFHHRMQEVLHNYHTAQARYLSGQSQLFLDAVPAITNMKSGRSQVPRSNNVSPTKVNMPGLKVSTNTTGTSVTINNSLSPDHYVGQVNLPPPGTKSPPKKPAPVATPSPEKQPIAPPSPEKQSIPVPNFDDDDDDGAFFGSAPMGGTTGDPTRTNTAAAPPAAAPPMPPPTPNEEPPKPPQEEPPQPPPSPQKEKSISPPTEPAMPSPPAEEPPQPPPSPQKEANASPSEEEPPLPPPSPQEEESTAPPTEQNQPSHEEGSDLVQENSSSDTDDED